MPQRMPVSKSRRRRGHAMPVEVRTPQPHRGPCCTPGEASGQGRPPCLGWPWGGVHTPSSAAQTTLSQLQVQTLGALLISPQLVCQISHALSPSETLARRKSHARRSQTCRQDAAGSRLLRSIMTDHGGLCEGVVDCQHRRSGWLAITQSLWIFRFGDLS